MCQTVINLKQIWIDEKYKMHKSEQSKWKQIINLIFQYFYMKHFNTLLSRWDSEYSEYYWANVLKEY